MITLYKYICGMNIMEREENFRLKNNAGIKSNVYGFLTVRGLMFWNSLLSKVVGAKNLNYFKVAITRQGVLGF